MTLYSINFEEKAYEIISLKSDFIYLLIDVVIINIESGNGGYVECMCMSIASRHHREGCTSFASSASDDILRIYFGTISSRIRRLVCLVRF